jgi:hypothetical protein
VFLNHNNNTLFIKNSPKMTLWVTQSASNSHQSPKMSVNSESTHQNTSRMMYLIIILYLLKIVQK